MKKILTVICCLCLFVNISFAFDPYADEEQETRSKSKLYWGIFMTLVGGFLAYDGFSQEEVDISKPSVDYGGTIHASWAQSDVFSTAYTLRSGIKFAGGNTEISDDFQQNVLYNNGNVDLKNITIYVRYRYSNGEYVTQKDYPGRDPDYYFRDDPNTHIETIDGGYIVAKNQITGESLKIGEGKEWSDWVCYGTAGSDAPGQLDTSRTDYYQENALAIIDVKVVYDYKHKYKKQNKSDIEGVAGLMVATAGIYFIVDYFMDLHKFNQYMKRNDINIRLANAPNEYKLLFQKRL